MGRKVWCSMCRRCDEIGKIAKRRERECSQKVVDYVNSLGLSKELGRTLMEVAAVARTVMFKVYQLSVEAGAAGLPESHAEDHAKHYEIMVHILQLDAAHNSEAIGEAARLVDVKDTN